MRTVECFAEGLRSLLGIAQVEKFVAIDWQQRKVSPLISFGKSDDLIWDAKIFAEPKNKQLARAITDLMLQRNMIEPNAHSHN